MLTTSASKPFDRPGWIFDFYVRYRPIADITDHYAHLCRTQTGLHAELACNQASCRSRRCFSRHRTAASASSRNCRSSIRPAARSSRHAWRCVSSRRWFSTRSGRIRASWSPDASCCVKRSLSRLRLGSRFEGDGAARREMCAEAATRARRAVDLEVRLVAPEHVLGDGEAEAGAARVARAAAIDAVEALGEPWDVFHRDADTRIGDAERGAVRAVVPGDGHFAAGRRVADSVGNEVAEGARDLRLGAEQIDLRPAFDADRMAALRERRGVGAEALEQRRDAHPLGRRRRRRLEHREREQVLDDALHAGALLAHHADVVAYALRVELELAHGLQETYQHRERRTQLVRDVGDEIAPHGLDALRLGDVAREQQRL